MQTKEKKRAYAVGRKHVIRVDEPIVEKEKEMSDVARTR